MKIKFEDLIGSDFHSYMWCEGSGIGGYAGDIISRLFYLKNRKETLTGIGNTGGIRIGNVLDGDGEIAFIAIEDRGNSTVWKNKYDEQTKILEYHGDNNSSKDPFDTVKKGNRHLFENYRLYNSTVEDRVKCPPIFYFQTKKEGLSFIGLAFPFIENEDFEDLYQIYDGSINGKEFKNYLFKLSVADNISIAHEWLYDLKQGKKYGSKYEPQVWKEFIEYGSNMNINKFQRKFEVDLIKEEKSIYKYGLFGYEENLKTNLVENDRQKCEICKCENEKTLEIINIVPPLIKPDEIYNPENVVLLCSNHSMLFKQGYITFDKFGKILLSNRIHSTELSELNIDKNMRIKMSRNKREFMNYHNKKVFTKY